MFGDADEDGPAVGSAVYSHCSGYLVTGTASGFVRNAGEGEFAAEFCGHEEKVTSITSRAPDDGTSSRPRKSAVPEAQSMEHSRCPTILGSLYIPHKASRL